jgi:PTS system nitrogen regulatory IIA component
MSDMIGIGRRQAAPDGKPDKRALAEMLSPRDILLEVKAPGKMELLEAIGQHMEWVHGIGRELVLRSLLHREQIGSTAMGQGVAIPHARIDNLEQIRIAYLHLATPIAFDAPDDKPVEDVFVILVPKPATEVHLRILGEASQMFADAPFRAQLHGCTHPADVKLLFDTRGRSLR